MVGVDVKVMGDLDVANLATHVLSDEEFVHFSRQEISDRKRDFYLLWTLKESILKMDGRGLDVSPSALTIDLSNMTIRATRELSYVQHCHLRYFSLDTSSILAVCSIASEVQTPTVLGIDGLLHRLGV